jgi:SAM-dependent methyltransferase
MDPTFLALLKCPACGHVGMASSARRVVCPACDREFDREPGWINLLDVDPRGETPAFSAEQRLMESELVARVYERFWRPTFVRLVAGSGAGAATGGFAGELFIHKNALAMDERRGPWLDLSCGPGTFTRAMAASGPGDLIIGLDISRAMLDAAVGKVKGYANVVLVRADAQELPFGDATLGGVNCSGALHAYDDPPQAFREILRVLRPGGLWVASTFAPARSLLGKAAARLAGIRRFAPHELRSQLSRIGFADYEEIRFGDSFIFRARKP